LALSEKSSPNPSTSPQVTISSYFSKYAHWICQKKISSTDSKYAGTIPIILFEKITVLNESERNSTVDMDKAGRVRSKNQLVSIPVTGFHAQDNTWRESKAVL
jgi:hypothetical protein